MRIKITSKLFKGTENDNIYLRNENFSLEDKKQIPPKKSVYLYLDRTFQLEDLYLLHPQKLLVIP